MNISFGQTALERAESGHFKGVSCYLNLIHTTDNTAFVDGDLSLQNPQIEVILNSKKYGRKEVIQNMPLQDALAGLNQENADFVAIRTWTALSIVQVAAAAATKEQRILSLEIPFLDIVHLEVGDTLEVKLQTAGSNPNGVIGASSTCTVEFRAGVGNAVGIPFAYRVPVPVGSSSAQVACKDGTKLIALVNHDKSTVTTATQVCTGVGISSDKFADQFSVEELYGIRQRTFENSVEAILRYQNFVLYRGMELNGARINGGFTGAQVASDKNSFIIAGVEVTPETLNKHQQRAAKHFDRNVKAVLKGGR